MRGSSFEFLFFYVLPLNGFTAEEVEGSVSDVTAEKKTALTYRKTPFWRIKSVKWLWKCGQRGWMCLPAEELSGKRLNFSCQFLKVFFVCLCFLVEALNCRSLSRFQSRFSLLTAPLALSSQLFLPQSPIFLFWSNHFQLFLLPL